jgi:hypothetical protein
VCFYDKEYRQATLNEEGLKARWELINVCFTTEFCKVKSPAEAGLFLYLKKQNED